MTATPDAEPAPAGPDGPTAFTRTVELDLDTESAWRLVGTTDGLATWLGHDVHADLAPGGALHLVDDDGTTRTGAVTDLQPGRSLSFRWADGEATSEVTITVDDAEHGGSRITVTEAVARTGSRPMACTDAGTAWDGRLLALELGALATAPAFAALA